jgi:hypothetical protein
MRRALFSLFFRPQDLILVTRNRRDTATNVKSAALGIFCRVRY